MGKAAPVGGAQQGQKNTNDLRRGREHHPLVDSGAGAPQIANLNSDHSASGENGAVEFLSQVAPTAGTGLVARLGGARAQVRAAAAGQLATALLDAPEQIRTLAVPQGAFQALVALLLDSGADDDTAASVQQEKGGAGGEMEDQEVLLDGVGSAMPQLGDGVGGDSLYHAACTVRLAAAGTLRSLTDPEAYAQGATPENVPAGRSLDDPLDVDLVPAVAEHLVRDVGICSVVAQALDFHLAAIQQQQLAGGVAGPSWATETELLSHLFGLLWNLVEVSDAAVEQALETGLLTRALTALGFFEVAPGAALAAAQFLHVVSEDNPQGGAYVLQQADALQALCSVQESDPAPVLHLRALVAGFQLNAYTSVAQPGAAPDMDQQAVASLMPVLQSVIRLSLSNVGLSPADLRAGAAAREIALESFANWSLFLSAEGPGADDAAVHGALELFVMGVLQSQLLSTVSSAATNAAYSVDDGAAQQSALACLHNFLSVLPKAVESVAQMNEVVLAELQAAYNVLVTLAATPLTSPAALPSALAALQTVIRLASNPFAGIDGVTSCPLVKLSHVHLVRDLVVRDRGASALGDAATRAAACGCLGVMGCLDIVCDPPNFGAELDAVASALVSRLGEENESDAFVTCEAIHAVLECLAEPHTARQQSALGLAAALLTLAQSLPARIPVDLPGPDRERCEEALMNIDGFVQYISNKQ